MLETLTYESCSSSSELSVSDLAILADTEAVDVNLSED